MSSNPTQRQDATVRRPADREQRRAPETKFRAMTFPRKRAVTACETCRSRKTKCDNIRPVCSNCDRHNLPCSYDPRLDHSSFDPASLLIIEKLNETIQKVDEIGRAVGTHSAWIAHLVPDASTGTQVSLSAHQNVERDRVTQSCDYDCLEVLGAFGSADSVLTWPIFAGRWPRDILSNELYVANLKSTQRNIVEGNPRGKNYGINEEDAPELVNRFLQLVHSKNPIFNSQSILQDAKRFAENGFGWDASSCVMLLVCALGTIASPHDPSYEGRQLHRSVDEEFDRRNIAEAYYQLARKRLGLLDGSLMACQCYLLSGIYLMYSIQPIQAWSAFHNAASTYSLYLKGKAGLWEGNDAPASTSKSSERRLEQRLYWTCLKSECEIRSELDLPQSDLCDLKYPYLFPSPPTPSSPVNISQDDLYVPTPASDTTIPSHLHSVSSSSSYQSLEEQSWFYYLSEIALRRIENRVLNTFYREDHYTWSSVNMQVMINAAEDIEGQLTAWYSSLPGPIRFENLSPDESPDELRSMTQGRSIIIRLLLYRPFLYYTVHSRHQMDSETSARVDSLAQKALDVCIEYHSSTVMRHRHHGTWYGLRGAFATGLMLVAAKVSGIITWRSWSPDSENPIENQYGHAVQMCLETLRYWESESTDCARSRDILENLINTSS